MPEGIIPAVGELVLVLRQCAIAIEAFRSTHPACIPLERIAPGGVGVFNRGELSRGLARAGLSWSAVSSALAKVEALPISAVPLAAGPRPLVRRLREAFRPGDDEVVDGEILDVLTALESGVLVELGRLPGGGAVDAADQGRDLAAGLPPDDTPGLRPAYRRDHLWLRWHVEGLGPARIRDRWNAMPEGEQRLVSPRCFGGRVTADVVKEGRKKALREEQTSRKAAGNRWSHRKL